MNNAVIQNGIPRVLKGNELGSRDVQVRSNHMLPAMNPLIYANTVNIYQKSDIGGMEPPPLPGAMSQNTAGVMGSSYQSPSDFINQVSEAASFAAFYPEFASNLEAVLKDPSVFQPLHSVGQATTTLVDKLTGLTSQNKQLGFTGFGLGRKIVEDVSGEYKSIMPALMDINNRISNIRQTTAEVKEHMEIDDIRKQLDELRQHIPYGAFTNENQLREQENIKKISSQVLPPPPPKTLEIDVKKSTLGNVATVEKDGRLYMIDKDPTKHTDVTAQRQAMGVISTLASAVPGLGVAVAGLNVLKEFVPQGKEIQEIKRQATAKDIVGYKSGSFGSKVPIYSKEYTDYVADFDKRHKQVFH